MKQDLKFYYDACTKVIDMFAKQYFTDKDITLNDLDMWWVADSPGIVLQINGYFWDMETMVEALKERVSKKTLFEYYDWSVEDNPLIENRSLHHFINLKAIKKNETKTK